MSSGFGAGRLRCCLSLRTTAGSAAAEADRRVRSDISVATAGSIACRAAARDCLRVCLARAVRLRCVGEPPSWEGAARSRTARIRHRETHLMPTAAHFIYIPGVLLIGIVIGWILGSRAAADAYAAELRKRGA